MRNKTLVGIVTFGNLKYTQITINSIIRNTDTEVDFFVVVGKPGDTETRQWLIDNKIPHTVHEENLGFPYSINDIYDHAWVHNDYDNLVLAGNDVYVYPQAVDSMIKLAETTDYEVISALQYDVRSLFSEFEEARKYIDNGSYTINDLNAQPWLLFDGWKHDEPVVADMQLYDIQNLCLYTKKYFEDVGYVDVNFYPAYFVDNDLARRIVNSGIRCCSLVSARFFHFWSRTIKEERGGSTGDYFRANQRYYRSKWGGNFGSERLNAPVKIGTRDGEKEQIARWRK